MDENTKRWLSVIGLVMSIVGFYVKNAGSFPMIQGFIAPTYVDGKSAVERIRREGSISNEVPEFVALARVVEDWVAARNPLVPRDKIVLQRLEAGGGGIAFGRASSTQTVNLKAYFQGQAEPVSWDLLRLEAELESRWTSASLSWAVWLFWLGVFQSVWPMFITTKRPPAPSPPHVEETA